MTIFVMQGTTLAGKTEHGRRLAKELGADYIASGDIARSLMDAATKAEFSEGKLSPHDKQIREAIYKRIADAKESVVLDGFPRIPAHVIDFIMWRHDTFKHPPKIVVIKIAVPVSVIIARGENRKRDEFDTAATILKRHAVYKDETEPALDFMVTFFGHGVAVSLPAEAEKTNVYSAIVDELADGCHI